ncbi:MAG TPA: RtcB family protein [Tepidisphaeraceae bacterium]|nr:RtcB family protein [Tepidisphaeraceae bacterium]
MKAKDLLKIGFKPGPAIGVALKLIPDAKRALGARVLRDDLEALAREPNAYTRHPHLALLAQALIEHNAKQNTYVEREQPAPYQVWGHNLEAGSTDQMKNAVRLPVSVAGALMPDAHQGYGLPIGGVLATHNSVIPYGVGVDIACRMKLSVLDIPAADLDRMHDELCRVIERETVFGTGKEQKKAVDHPVLEEDWSVTPTTKHVFDKARAQIGTSGSGNHFVEFGILTVHANAQSADNVVSPGGDGAVLDGANLAGVEANFDLPPGAYLALLSHSGSRGAGAAVADRYSKLAMDLHPELPPDLRRLAWLDLDSDPGREYWAAMNLMGQYAHANHDVIHRKIVKALKAKVIAGVENHHNFAWKEIHDGKEVIVHRKGATPAGKGVLGVIPGSMATPGFVVRGKGLPSSLMSASHGAGRQMSRTAAKAKFRWGNVKPILKDAGVTLLSAGIDEVPGSYKDIKSVMQAQSDLVEVIAQFDPKIVKMAPEGEKPED